MSSVKQELHGTPRPCTTGEPGCAGTVTHVNMGACNRCFRRACERFWRAMGWEMRGRWVPGEGFRHDR